MARGLHLLTDKAIKAAKAGAMLNDGGGLTLRVAKDGAGRWSFRFKLPGHKQREMGLGSYPAVSLAMAREKAARARELVAKGEDPIDHAEAAAQAAEAAMQEAKAKATTFEQFAKEDFLPKALERVDNEKSRQRINRSILTHCEPLLNKPLSGIGPDDLLEVLRPIWKRVPVSAAYTREYLKRLFDRAIKRKLHPGPNPAEWDHFEDELAAPQKRPEKHHASVSYKQVPTFVKELRARQESGDSARAALLLEMLILTAGRTSEIRLAKWSEVDFSTKPKTLTIPRERLKNRKYRILPHVIPLTPRMLAILEAAKALAPDGVKPDAFIFPGMKDGRPLSQMACDMLMRRMGYGDFTVHGFRATFKTWSFTCTSFARELVEDQLTHEMGAVEAAYVRAAPIERRLELLDAWEKHLETGDAEVVPDQAGGADE